MAGEQRRKERKRRKNAVGKVRERKKRAGE